MSAPLAHPIAAFGGPRSALRALFEEAEDSAEVLDDRDLEPEP